MSEEKFIKFPFKQNEAWDCNALAIQNDDGTYYSIQIRTLITVARTNHGALKIFHEWANEFEGPFYYSPCTKKRHDGYHMVRFANRDVTDFQLEQKTKFFNDKMKAKRQSVTSVE